MPRFDWNGNGRQDAFDSFMDMKVVSDVSGSPETEYSDFDDTDADPVEDDTFVESTARVGTSSRLYMGSQRGTTKMSFQNELKQNLRTPDVVKKENVDREYNARLTEAKLTLHDIKKTLLQSAKDARYTTYNGVTTISCLCRIPQRYLRRRSENNGNQLIENQQKFVLFRDPDLIYRTWDSFDVEPKYASEYRQYAVALKQVAAEENISIEFVVHGAKEDKIYPFPTKVPSVYTIGWYLCARATTCISADGSTIMPPKPVTIPEVRMSALETRPVATAPESPATEKSQDTNGSVLFKSLLAIGLVVGAFALCLSGEMGQLGWLLLIGAAFGGYFILKK